MTRKQWFFRGMRAGIPISLGYFAVSIALGLAAKRAGITSLQAALTSLLINASAGEYAGFTLMAVGASYLEVTLMVAVANARYLLMSAALSQKLQEGVGTFKRLLLGFTVTDEIFGVSMIQSEPLDPAFTYGCFLVATTGWTSGTFVGSVLGDILPPALLSALGVGLYGMFISVFVPEAKKNRVVLALIGISFILSFSASVLPLVREISEGVRIIILTVVISLLAAIFFPVGEKESEQKEGADA